jgi:hypothetical protein
MKKTRNLVLLIALALVLVAGAVGGGYAYWAGTLTGPDQVEEEAKIEIGTGQDVITTVKLTKTVVGGNLVPKGRKVEATDVEEVVLTFDVLWTDVIEDGDASHGAVGELTITTSFDNNPSDLLIVDVNGEGTITAGTTQTVTITITLTEPADVAQYESVAGKEFTLEITFSVV